MRTNVDISGVLPSIAGTITPSSGSPINITNADIVANSFSYTGGTSNSNEFTVGAAIISSINFSLMNDTGRFSGIDWYNSRVTFSLTCDGTTVNYGTYWVVNHHEIGNIIKVECYDALKILDEYEMYEVTPNITFPSDVSTIVSAIVSFLSTATGFTFTYSGLRNGSLRVEEITNEHMTMRACLSYLTQMTGQYVRAISYELRFGWYDMSSSHHAGTTFSHDLRTSNDVIGGINVSDYNDASFETRGSGYKIDIANNPFITANNIVAVADAIYNSAFSGGIAYRPGDISIVASPAYEPGDYLLVNTAKEQNVPILATTITYKPQLQQPITADASPYAGDLRINRSAYVKQQAKNAINDELKDPNSDLSEAIADAGGMKTFFLKQNIVTLSSNVTVSRLNASGLENVSTSYTAYHIGGHMVTVPSYSQTLQGTREFFVPIRCDLQTVYAGVAMFRAKWISDHEIRFFDGGESAKGVWFMDARNTPVIFWVRAHLWSTSNTAVFDLDRNEWTGT